jgi:hypothetical protein
VGLNRITCPECGAGLKSASGFTPGQTVCCSKCETYFAVDAPSAADDDYEDDPPRSKKKRRGDEERSYRNSPARYAVLAVLVVVMCVLGYMLYDKKQREAEDLADNPPDNNKLIPPAGPIPPRPKGLPKGGAVGGVGGGGGGKKDIAPKQPNPGGGSPFDLLPGAGSPPTVAEADALTKKYQAMLVGTWKAELGKDVTAELVYGADGTVKETVTTSTGPTVVSGKWSVTGLVGRKGIAVAWTGDSGKTGPHRLVFEDDELEHPVGGQNIIGIFRKKK